MSKGNMAHAFAPFAPTIASEASFALADGVGRCVKLAAETLERKHAATKRLFSVSAQRR